MAVVRASHRLRILAQVAGIEPPRAGLDSRFQFRPADVRDTGSRTYDPRVFVVRVITAVLRLGFIESFIERSWGSLTGLARLGVSAAEARLKRRF